jgi:hypothetical protein
MTEPKLTIQAKFEAALNLAISLCMDAGMSPVEMIGPLQRELDWCQNSRDLVNS